MVHFELKIMPESTEVLLELLIGYILGVLLLWDTPWSNLGVSGYQDTQDCLLRFPVFLYE